MISRVETDKDTFITQVIWSEEMLKRFGQLRGNQYEITNLLSRLFIELKVKQDEVITELGCQFAKAIDQKDREIATLSDRITEMDKQDNLTTMLFGETAKALKSLNERINEMENRLMKRLGIF